jgi:NAD-dependent SIR2 family protein deacetylase
MWELLRDYLGFADEHLTAKILEIDSRDGTVDGKIGADVIDCPHCGQKASTIKPRCMYCGHSLPSSHVMK